jgi:hypothetical protein
MCPDKLLRALGSPGVATTRPSRNFGSGMASPCELKLDVSAQQDQSCISTLKLRWL